MKKKVCFVITRLTSGGAERVISILANYFSEKGLRVKIIALRDDQIDYPLNANVKHKYIGKKFNNKALSIIERMYKIRKEVKGYDIVISFLWFINIYVVLSTIFMDKKIIISDRSDPENELKGMPFFVKSLRNLAYSLADKVIFQTPDAKNHYSSIIQRNSVIIPNPINPNLPKMFQGERKKKIVSLGRLSEQKNYKLLIDSFFMLLKEYPDYQLIIYGEGELRTELENYIKTLGIEENVKLPGFKKDVHKRIIDSAIYVSSSNYEGISNALLEALGMGIPTIATDCPVGGSKMFVHNNVNGILIPIKDKQALYLAMKKIIENPNFSEKISRNAVKINKQLSHSVIGDKWLEQIHD